MTEKPNDYTSPNPGTMSPFNRNEISRKLRSILESVSDSDMPIEIRRRDGTVAAVISEQDVEQIQDSEFHLVSPESDLQPQSVSTTSKNREGDNEIPNEQDGSNGLDSDERRYQELFDDSPVAIWVEDWSAIKKVVDPISKYGEDGIRTHFKTHRDQLKQVYGMASSKEISQAAIRLYNEDSLETLLEHTEPEEVVEEELEAFLDIIVSFCKGSFSLDMESRDIDGDRKEIVIRRQVVIPPAHQADWSRIIYAIEDITERVQLEQQLIQAQKMETVGQLTGGLAHDFNNLLAIIQGNADLLLRSLGIGHEFVEPILRATERGADLTQHLLAFSRRQPLQPKVIDLDDLVSRMSNILVRTLGEDIEIVQESVSDLWFALADPGQLENALLNLTLNARDAMRGGGTLRIECSNIHVEEESAEETEELRSGDYVILAVSDTGHGMNSEVKERAFEPFFTTKDVGSGSGLGLSMIYGFAKQSGGHVNIFSEMDRGTKVELYLQRYAGPGVQIDRHPPRKSDRRGGESVLLIEDDQDVRTMTKRMLQRLGYEVTDVPNAAAAHDSFHQRGGFDLVLSDVVLPGGMNGPELVDLLIKDHPLLKVLFISGYTAETAMGGDFIDKEAALLTKPFSMSQLSKALRELLD